MRIAVNAQAYHADFHTGIGSYTENLYKNIFKIVRDEQFIFFSPKPSEDFVNIGRNNVTFKKAPNLNASKYLRVGWENIIFPMCLFRFRPDLSHCVNYTLPYKTMYGMKKIVTVHDITWVQFPDFFDKKVGYLAKKRMQYSCRTADAIITVSGNTKRELLNSFDCCQDKITTIYLGVEHERFRKIDIKPEIKSVICSKYELGEKFILWVGGFRKNKNIERLCRAFIKVKEKIDCPHKLVLCGHKDFEYQRIRELFKKWDKFFVYTGAVEDDELPIIYNMADAFVLPSLHEGFGLPVLEAMACGAPVIASNSSSLPEVAGDAAVFVDPQDEQELSEAIIKLIDDESLKNSLILKGLARAKLFTWEETARRTLELFKKVGDTHR